LLSKPVTRTEIITQKLLAVTVNVVLLNIFIILVSLIGFGLTKDADVSIKTFMLLSAATLMLHLTFAAVSFLLSTIMKKTRNIVSISLGIVFVEYFLHVMSGVSDKLKDLNYVSAFSYVDASKIITSNELEPLYVFIMAAVIILSSASAYIIYRKKDITI
jgi:ABC-2 type transport system permease protein